MVIGAEGAEGAEAIACRDVQVAELQQALDEHKAAAAEQQQRQQQELQAAREAAGQQRSAAELQQQLDDAQEALEQLQVRQARLGLPAGAGAGASAGMHAGDCAQAMHRHALRCSCLSAAITAASNHPAPAQHAHLAPPRRRALPMSSRRQRSRLRPCSSSWLRARRRYRAARATSLSWRLCWTLRGSAWLWHCRRGTCSGSR
jgi:hypothetical protein